MLLLYVLAQRMIAIDVESDTLIVLASDAHPIDREGYLLFRLMIDLLCRLEPPVCAISCSCQKVCINMQSSRKWKPVIRLILVVLMAWYP